MPKITKSSPSIDIVHDWQPPDPLKLLKKDNSFAYRWIRKSEVDLRLQQGWEVVDKKGVGLATDQRVARGSSTVAECNELVLCRRPRDMNTAHRSYLDTKNRRIMEALGSQFHREGQRSGCATYGDVTIEQKQ